MIKATIKIAVFGLVKGIIKMIGLGSLCFFLTKSQHLKQVHCQFVFCLLCLAMFYDMNVLFNISHC